MSSGQESRPSSRPRRLRGWRRIVFPLGAVALGLAPFVVLEGALTIFDVGGRGRGVDPLVGFSRTQPLFELDEEDDVYRTARSRQLYFGQQQFARQKPEGTFRIFGLGGSTVRGRPYETDTSFLKWLQIELGGRDSTRRYETVNCGGLSYASYRSTWILDEVLQYEPDLLIIATGHNEFLEDRTYDSIKNRSPWANWALERLHSLRTVALASRLRGNPEVETDPDHDGSVLGPEVNARLDSLSGYASYHRDDAWRRDVIEHFERSVRAMVDTCRRARVPLVLVNLGENLRDCPPSKSEHGPGLSTKALQRWQVYFDKATAWEDADPDEALKLYREAESIDDQYALLLYRMARCFDRLEQARRCYALAKDLDICPLRMLDEMHERLKRIARETGVPLLDAQQLLVDLSPDGIPGNNCFMDHVHPDIGSHQRIAQALALKLEETSLVTGNRTWTDAQRRHTYRRHLQQLGPAYLANGRHRVGWLENWACRERLDRETVPKDARGRLHLGQKRLDYGEYNLAWEQFQLAMKEKPRLAGDVLDHALELFKQGRGNLAEEILIRLHYEPQAAALRPHIELACLVLALDAGKTREAETLLARYRDGMEQAAQSSRGWLDVMPDALQQVKAQPRRDSQQVGADPGVGPPGLDTAHPRSDVDQAGRLDVATLQLDPERVDAPIVASEQQGAREKAAAELKVTIRLLGEAIRREPSNHQLYLRRARLYCAMRDFDAALADSTKAVELASDRPDGYKLRAAVHTIQRRPQQAAADLTKAIDLDPSDPDALKARGYVYQRLGESAKAEADFAAARKLSADPASQ